MMVICYLVGQRHFPVPYPVRKLLSYAGVMTGLFLAQQAVTALTSHLGNAGLAIRLGSGLILMGTFAALVLKTERQELGNFPVIGKYLK
jgi:hypothetical protein